MTIQATFNFLGQNIRGALLKIDGVSEGPNQSWTGKIKVFKTKSQYEAGKDPVFEFSYAVPQVDDEDPKVTLYNGLKDTGILKSIKDL